MIHKGVVKFQQRFQIHVPLCKFLVKGSNQSRLQTLPLVLSCARCAARLSGDGWNMSNIFHLLQMTSSDLLPTQVQTTETTWAFSKITHWRPTELTGLVQIVGILDAIDYDNLSSLFFFLGNIYDFIFHESTSANWEHLRSSCQLSLSCGFKLSKLMKQVSRLRRRRNRMRRFL